MLKLTIFDYDHGGQDVEFGSRQDIEAILLRRYPKLLIPGMQLDEMVQAINTDQIYSVRVDETEPTHMIPSLDPADWSEEDPWPREGDE